MLLRTRREQHVFSCVPFVPISVIRVSPLRLRVSAVKKQDDDDGDEEYEYDNESFFAAFVSSNNPLIQSSTHQFPKTRMRMRMSRCFRLNRPSGGRHDRGSRGPISRGRGRWG
jgi:hypothetical protein